MKDLTLTELLERVDWSRMAVTGWWGQSAVRHIDDDIRCPLEVATNDVLYRSASLTATNTSSESLEAVMQGADYEHPLNPGAARWRAWMLKRIQSHSPRPRP